MIGSVPDSHWSSDFPTSVVGFMDMSKLGMAKYFDQH